MSTPEPLPELRLHTANYTVYHYLSWRKNDNEFIDLDAPYRRGSVWTDDQRRNLIKSLAMGLPVGTLIISLLPYREGGASCRVVDGKQRIEAVRAFYRDEFTVPGWWFEEEDLSGPELREADVLFSQLSQRGQRGIEHAPLGCIEFKADVEYIPNLEYDPTLRPGYSEFKDNPHKTNRYNIRHRSDEEILRAEAELYLLVNFGGVEQTETTGLAPSRSPEVHDGTT